MNRVSESTEAMESSHHGKVLKCLHESGTLRKYKDKGMHIAVCLKDDGAAELGQVIAEGNDPKALLHDLRQRYPKDQFPGGPPPHIIF